jgi:hypothetical protein
MFNCSTATLFGRECFLFATLRVVCCLFVWLEPTAPGGPKFDFAVAALPLRKFCEKFLGLDIMGEYRRIRFDDG